MKSHRPRSPPNVTYHVSVISGANNVEAILLLAIFENEDRCGLLDQIAGNTVEHVS
jgi:hypothetical protein